MTHSELLIRECINSSSAMTYLIDDVRSKNYRTKDFPLCINMWPHWLDAIYSIGHGAFGLPCSVMRVPLYVCVCVCVHTFHLQRDKGELLWYY